MLCVLSAVETSVGRLYNFYLQSCEGLIIAIRQRHGYVGRACVRERAASRVTLLLEARYAASPEGVDATL